MKGTKTGWALIAALAWGAALLAEEDANTAARAAAPGIGVDAAADVDGKARVEVALGRYPGPLTSYYVVLQLTNLSDQYLKQATIKYRRCLGGAGLVIDDMWGATGPAATWTGVDTNKIVLRFLGFGPGQTFSIIQDPDTRDDPSSSVYVQDLAGAKATLKFEGRQKKGKGRFKVSGSDVIAKIKRKEAVK